MNLRESFERAVEAIEDGDDLFASEILRAALERFDGEPIARPYHCPDCGNDYEWPGLLDAHRYHCLRRVAA